jgi:uncharacterized protein
MTEDRQTILEFPTIFPLKVMGHHRDDFEAFVVEMVLRHTPHSAHTVSSRPSKNGTYLSVTVTFVAESQGQLDAIYEELSTNKRVLMAL